MRLPTFTVIATTAALLGLGAAAPVLAAPHSHHRAAPKHRLHRKLSLRQANVAAKHSADPLKQLATDQVTVSGCTPVARDFTCGVKLVPTDSNSTCVYTVVVGVVRGLADAKQYSSVTCTG